MPLLSLATRDRFRSGMVAFRPSKIWKIPVMAVSKKRVDLNGMAERIGKSQAQTIAVHLPAGTVMVSGQES